MRDAQQDLLEKTAKELMRKIKVFFSLTGFKSDVLPGIKIAVVPSVLLLLQYRRLLLKELGLESWQFPADYLLVGMLAVVVAVACWFVSGWLFDPPFDWLYGPDMPFAKRRRRFGPFPPGHQLNVERSAARLKLIKEGNEEKYKDPDISILDPVIEVLEKFKSSELGSIRETLDTAKTLRNAILPVVGLVAAAASSNAHLFTGLLFVLALVLFVSHCSRRQDYLVKVYRKYNEAGVPATLEATAAGSTI